MLAMLIMAGCASKTEYYEAQKRQDQAILEANKKTSDDRVSFTGKFDGTIEIVQGKEQPRFNKITQPKDWRDYAMSIFGISSNLALGVAGYHYNFKSADSSNKYNAENINSWTGNYQNASSTNTSTSVTSNTDTSSVTDNQTTTNTQSTVPVTVDTTGTTVGP